jgi:DNA-binding transcriptional MerR regulator
MTGQTQRPKQRRRRAANLLNAFTAEDVQGITGLSVHMASYLAREGYLTPTYENDGVRGKVRYYSYRDLVVAKIVRGFLDHGLELKRLKDAIKELSSDKTWFPPHGKPLSLLATDGRRLYYPDPTTGSLVELTRHRQQAFAFVINVERAQEAVRAKLGARKAERYTLLNEPLVYHDSVREAARIVRRIRRR